MKKSFHMISLLALLLTFAVSTAWAAQRTLEPDGNGGYYINMPATGTDELVIPDNVTSFKVYDDGGAEGGYTPNSDGFLVLTAPEGRLLRLTGSTGAVNSYLYVYDGSDVSNYLFSKTGFKDVGRTLSSGRSLLLEFTTYSTVTDGLYLDVTVVDPSAPHAVVINDIEHGSIFASPIEADAGTTISLTITPEEGYYLDKINVTDEYNNSLSYDDYGNPVNGFTGGKWYSGGVASFTMPRTDAIVRSTFYSIDKYLDLQMPSTGELPVIIPNSVSTFLIRPDYYGTENNTIVLTAPEGKILQIMSEDMTNSGDDSLYVYDGTDENATLLKKSLAREIGRPISTQHVMALHYKGDGKYRSRDAFRVTVLDPSVYNNVTVTNNAGGTVTPSVSSATANTSVTLTATPNEGYMLDYVEAFDAEGLKVDVSNATWYESGEISFKMPGSAVEVKPVFVRVEDGPSINMLTSGSFALTIPEGMEKIHIYDDGGKNGNVSSNSKGYLVLSAPQGKKLRLGGSVGLISGYNTGHLTVYDGSDDNASELLDVYSTNRDIPTRLSAGSNIFVYFYATYGSCQGLDLTVTVVDPDAPHAINIVSVDDGNFINPPTEATPGTVVTLTASPNSGYFFNSVKIQDEYSTVSYEGNVDYTGGWYTNNTISFTMPQTEVTVTPSFDYVQYADVVIKRTGTETISILDEIKSFELKAGYSEDAIESSILLTAPEGMLLQIQGEVAPRTGVDSLYVYDGVDANATELLKVAARASVSINGSGQNMLIHYKELGEVRGYETGLSVRVTVVDPNQEYAVSVYEGIDNGSVEVNKASATFNTPVTVTAIPDDNKFLNRIEVIGKDSWNPVTVTGGTWYSSNEATFAMPPEGVIVGATFVNELSADAGISIHMPIYEPLRVSIPAGVESFILEGDDLGEGVPSKPLILTAPDGYFLQMYGNDGFGYGYNVYEGDIADPVGTNAEPVSEILGRTLTVVNLSSGDGRYNTVVTLIQNEEHAITVAAANEQGDVTISPVSRLAFAGDTVTVTGVPNEGYVFNGIKVKEGNGNGSELFEVTDGVWYNGEAKFVMPMKDVYLKPIFTEIGGDFQIKIPKTDTLRVTVPEGITWLEIFDDGGAGGNYSNGANGVLILTVPEGYTLVTGGEVDLYDENDSLYIYDGTGVNENVLAKVAEWAQFYNENEIYSTGRSLTFCLKSNTEENSDGLEMYATVLKTSNFGAVAVYDMNEYKYARVVGDYTGNETVSIPEPIEVDWIEYAREFTPDKPSTIVLPFELPEGTTTNADFYELAAVVQDGYKWKATFNYIGDKVVPQANKPYAVILPEDNYYLNFDWDEGFAELQTNDIDTVKVSNDNWLFVGTYSYKTWAAGDEELGLAYGVAATDNEGGAKKGKFGKIVAGASANPLRAYLRKKDASVQLSNPQKSRAAPGVSYNVSFVPEEIIDVEFVKASTDGSDEGTTVAEGRWNLRTGEFKMLRTHDVKGRKLNGTPKTRGAYYGKKVLNK